MLWHPRRVTTVLFRPLRASAAVLAAAALLTGLLTGCSGDTDEPDDDATSAGATDAAGAALTQACRTYLLAVGANDEAIVTQLAAATTGSGFEPDALTTAATVTATAATSAGSVEGLSDDDFQLFLDVSDAARTTITSVSDGGLPRAQDIGAVRGAVDRVREACEVSDPESQD